MRLQIPLIVHSSHIWACDCSLLLFFSRFYLRRKYDTWHFIFSTCRWLQVIFKYSQRDWNNRRQFHGNSAE